VTKSGNSYGITGIDDMFGVLDHNTINGDPQGGDYLQLAELNHASFMGQGQWGDYSWNQPENYGSPNFLFFEDNTFNHASCCENEGGAGALESRGGGRVVVRFNTMNSGLRDAITWHGTETGGRPRGGRAWEAYGNTTTCVGSTIQGTRYGCGDFIGARSGTGLTWGNSTNINSLSFGTFVALTTYRIAGNIVWPACDGASPYDINDTNGGSGNTAYVYYSGTIASYNSTTHVITVSGSPGWATDQWTPIGAPFSVHDVNQTTGTEITTNGSNTLTVAEGRGGPGEWTPAAGDTIQILRALACLDPAGGRGAGTLYSGDNTGPNPANPIASSNEAASPLYLWANPFSGGTPSGYVGANTRRIIRNRDFYAENINQQIQSSPTAPFDGSTAIGIGYGTLANRPTTCTTGVGYWAVDSGSNWNTTNTPIPGIATHTQGQFFVCTAANTWTLRYTPYTYPHPLVQP
jgi:hypothetical protein